MAYATSDDPNATLAEVAAEAQRALRERPSVSIRRRLTIGLVAWFVLSLGTTVSAIVLMARVEAKLDVLGAVDRFVFEIQQARRFEKNYLLYRTNLQDAVEQVRAAEAILHSESAGMAAVIGAGPVEAMAGHVQEYDWALIHLMRLGQDADSVDLARIEAALRVHGAEMVRTADELAVRERQSVRTILAVSQRIVLGFLIAQVTLIVVLAVFIARQMLAPLNRIMLATRRIAEGDLTPIRPRRRYRDEFSDLAEAINYMMQELIRRQQLLLHTHKLKAIGTLTAGVAHELNNPINNIMLTAASLQDGYRALSEPERLEMLADLVSESDRARDIVRNLLDFAREGDVELAPLNVETLIGETVQLAGNQIRLKNVRVCGEVDENLPPIRGDRHQLTQVFLNLVLNALHAMAPGGVLTISAQSTDDGNFVDITVTDTGVGIPENLLDSIFDPFFTTKKDAKGTGLGLSVSLGIVRQHGGDIRVSSEVGTGSVFTVSLPIARVPARMDRAPTP